MARVPASAATRKRIEAMMSGEGEAVEKSELVRAAARLIVEEALEEEVTDALGREFYEFELRQLNLLRNELNEQFGARHAPAVQPINPASRSRISSKRGT